MMMSHRLSFKTEEPYVACAAQKETAGEAAAAGTSIEESSDPVALYAAHEKHATLLRRLSKAHLAISLAPWLNIAFFTFYAFSARISLGYWPSGTESFNGGFLNFLSITGHWLFILCMAGAFPLLVLLSLVRIYQKQDHHLWRANTIFTLGWVINLWLILTR